MFGELVSGPCPIQTPCILGPGTGPPTAYPWQVALGFLAVSAAWGCLSARTSAEQSLFHFNLTQFKEISRVPSMFSSMFPSIYKGEAEKLECNNWLEWCLIPPKKGTGSPSTGDSAKMFFFFSSTSLLRLSSRRNLFPHFRRSLPNLLRTLFRRAPPFPPSPNLPFFLGV